MEWFLKAEVAGEAIERNGASGNNGLRAVAA
jgi:hypothetical protein